jgi:hypothetical protein
MRAVVVMLVVMVASRTRSYSASWVPKRKAPPGACGGSGGWREQLVQALQRWAVAEQGAIGLVFPDDGTAPLNPSERRQAADQQAGGDSGSVGRAPDAGMAPALQAMMIAGANLSSFSGWVQYVPITTTTTTTTMRQAKAGGPASGAAPAAADVPPGRSADVDPSALRVGCIVVVGVGLVPGAPVDVRVNGQAVPEGRATWDARGRQLNVSGIDAAAGQPLYVKWSGGVLGPM